MTPLVDSSIDTKAILYVGLDKKWKVNEMISLFVSIQDLYDFFSVLEGINKIGTESEKGMTKRTAYTINTFFKHYFFKILSINENDRIFIGKPSVEGLQQIELPGPLYVGRIEFSSPGLLELLGVKDILLIIKESIFKSIEIYQSRKMIAQKVKRQELQNKLLELEILDKSIRLLKLAGVEKQKIKELILYQVTSLERINKLISEEKIKDIK